MGKYMKPLPIKPQSVRLLDVFVLAPFMVYSGMRKSNLPMFFRAGLVMTGVLTGLYNARNYLEIQRVAETEQTITPESNGTAARYEA